MGQDLMRAIYSTDRSKRRELAALSLTIGMLLSAGFSSPPPVAAAVEVASSTLAEKDRQVMKELVAAFDRAEAAVQHADLEALMRFYAPAYNYHGLKRSDVRRVWDEVFSHYRAISSKHVFTELKLEKMGTVQKASVTCTGGLYGTERETEKPITIDSWVNEVHFLMKENGEWKFLGNAGGRSESAPVGSAPHHPLF